MVDAQLNLFATGIICNHCLKDPGPDPRYGHLWDGFFDADTLQHVCRQCRDIHYRKKWTTDHIGHWSEFPVMLTDFWNKKFPKTFSV